MAENASTPPAGTPQGGANVQQTILGDENQGGQQTPEQKAAAEKAAAEKAAADKKAADEKVAADKEAARKSLTEKLKAEGKTDAEIQAAIETAEKEAAEKAAKEQGAPDKYADFKLPKGMTLDKAMADQFIALAKELNLPQDKAQKLVDMYAGTMIEQAKVSANGFVKMVSDWAEETKTELGADAQKQLSFAFKAIQKFGSPGLRQLLNETGVGSHKEMVKCFIAIGKAISEDTTTPASGSGAGSESPEDVLYGKKK
jgi:hypothetical protein